MADNRKIIVLTGGGTAGHVTPNLALLPYLKEAGYKVYCDPDIALGHMGYAPVTRSFYEAMKENDNGTIG